MRVVSALGVAAVGVSAVGAGSAHAALVIGNMTAPFQGLTALTFPERRAASSFTLGAGFTPAELGSVTLAVGTATPGTGADAYLCFDNAGQPGATAVSLGSVLAPSVFTGVTFTPSAAYMLQPSTTYWVVLAHQAGGGDLQWVQNTGTTPDAGSNPHASLQTPSGSLLSFNFGATWSSTSGNPNQTFHFAINAVPAPGAAALLGAAGMLGMMRRRR